MRRPHPALHALSAAADTLVDTSVRSLDGNQLCGLYKDRFGCLRGMYTAEGIVKLSDALKVNKTLTSLRCTARPRLSNLESVSSR